MSDVERQPPTWRAAEILSSFFLLFFRLRTHLLHVVDALLSVEARTSFHLSVLDRLACGFKESTLLELQLTLNLFALDIGDQERRDQVLDDDLRLVALLLHLVKEVIDLADLKFGLVVGLQRRSIVNGLHDHRLQVGVNGSLMHLHELSIEDVLPVSEHLLSLTLARLLSLTLATLVLSQAHHGIDPSLLLQAHKFLRKRVHRLGDDRGLNSFSNSVHDTLLVVVNEHVLLLSLRVPLPLFSGTQLSDQVETLLLTFEHHVLLGTTSEQPLEEDDGAVFLVLHFPLLLVLLVSKLAFSGRDLPSAWSMSSKCKFVLFFLLIGLLFSALLVCSLLDEGVSLLERGLVIAILARELLAELEPDLVDTDHRVEDLRLLDLQDVMELLEALVRGKSFRLYFVLICLLVKGETVTRDWSING